MSDSRLPGPEDITRVVLPNGVVVLVRAHPHSPSVALQGYLQVGALNDPDDKLGLASLTAAALMRGTARYDHQALYAALEARGASLGFSGHTHTTGFGGQALAEDLPLLLEILAQALRFPTFPAQQVERLRAQWLTSLALREQNTSEMADLTFDRLAYDGHPYARPEDGTPETVRALTREDLEAFHRRHYGPRGMALALVGAIEPSQAVDLVAQALGDWQNPTQPAPPALPPVPPLRETRREVVFIPDKSQADIVLGVPGPPRTDPDYLPLALGNSVLGQFGLMGRIGEALRERAGLAYYAYSSLSGGPGPGPWTVQAGVAPQQVDPAIEMIRQELARFVREPVTAEELADVQSGAIGSLPLSFETNRGTASALLHLERYQLGLDYYQRYPQLVRAVTPERVLQAARRFLDPQRLAIAVAGTLTA